MKNVKKCSSFMCCAFTIVYCRCGASSLFCLCCVFCPVMSVGMEKPEAVEQVDLTPTLALGLGLPISQNSVGRVIQGVLEESSLRDQLRFLHLNGHQLSCLLKDSMPNYEKGGLQSHSIKLVKDPESQDRV